MDEQFLKDIEELAEVDGRYAKAAYLFIYDALQFTVEKLGKESLPKQERHVSGRELVQALSEYGVDQFGPLTLSVFEHWGVRETRDFGEIVFNLVGANLMSKTDNDCIDDFADVYNFDEEFEWKKRRAKFKRGA
jgi:uncharacterized repeat protein (TIGR04138 family)